MSRQTCLGVVGVAAALGAGVPAAGAQLPVGQSHGVRIVLKRGASGTRAVTFVFTRRAARLYRRVAGRKVTVRCVDLPRPGPGLGESGYGEESLRAPRRRSVLETGFSEPNDDYCRVFRARYKRRRGRSKVTVPRRLIVSIPLTQRGAVWLDEEAKTIRLLSLLELADTLSDGRGQSSYPSSAELMARTRGAVVALSSPGDTPPPGRLGYYSDARLHVAVVTLSASGRRLFVEYDGDLLSTSVAAHFTPSFGD